MPVEQAQHRSGIKTKLAMTHKGSVIAFFKIHDFGGILLHL
jgi:hypothetical protein